MSSCEFDQRYLPLGNSLLLFGCDFLPERHASELNFWRDIVIKFADEFSSVVIVSFNSREVDNEKLGKNIFLYNIQPIYFGRSKNQKRSEETGAAFNRLPLSVIYKSYNFLRYQSILETIISDYNITHFHFMRIFGLFNSQFVKRHPEIYFSMTVPTHIDRGFPFHYFYHFVKNEGMKSMDKLITTSKATKNRLEKLGISQTKIDVIAWTSSKYELEINDFTYKKNARQKYNIPDKAVVVLWSGPLQDTGEAEFYHSLEIAKDVISFSDRYYFIFTFKPGKMKTKYKGMIKDNQNLIIQETSNQEFCSIKSIATIFLSPILNINRTIAPPLTWIEMMQSGIPVITNNVDGVLEIIEHGKNGFIIDTIDEAVELILNIDSIDIESIGNNCVTSVNSKYSIDDISKKYISMWKIGSNIKK